MSVINDKLTHEKLLDQVHAVGPLDTTTINLVRMTTSLLHDDGSKFESLLRVCFDNGVAPSLAYHALFSLVDVVGLPKVMRGVSLIQKLVTDR